MVDSEPRNPVDRQAFSREVALFRRELLAHCYRMSGSLHEAEDLLQETFVRAWQAYPSFERRSALRTWLFRIATNVCLDALEKREARSLPEALGPPADPGAPMTPRTEPVWLEPYPDRELVDPAESPEAHVSARESVALAFLVVLQVLPARQRAAVLLHDVLGWSAAECAEAIHSSVAAVNSAIQRARESLQRSRGAPPPALAETDAEGRSVLQRYVRAWEDADTESLVSLLTDDAVLSMPPFPGWMQGARAIAEALSLMVFTADARGRFRLVPTRANGLPALATYQRDADAGAFRPVSIQLLQLEHGRIREVHAFLDPSLFPRFGLPETLSVP
jgi:RNA polymerase sigma-70 factor (ECF subfamily)